MVVPYPVQGHVIPLMELSICLAKQGIKITFVNTKDPISSQVHLQIYYAINQQNALNFP
jgi:hypothetical protein